MDAGLLCSRPGSLGCVPGFVDAPERCPEADQADAKAEQAGRVADMVPCGPVEEREERLQASRPISYLHPVDRLSARSTAGVNRRVAGVCPMSFTDRPIRFFPL